MKCPDKKFWGGFLLGFVAFPVMFFIVAYSFTRSHFIETGNLEPPDIPTEQRISLDWTVMDLDWQTINIKNSTGDKPVFLNFWATWCPPCVKEMPSIEKLYDKFKDRVFFACISKEELNDLGAFQKKKGVHIPIYKINGKVPSDFESRGIPATFIISPDGKILFKHVGGADWSHEKVVKFMEKMLADKTVGN